MFLKICDVKMSTFQFFIFKFLLKMKIQIPERRVPKYGVRNKYFEVHIFGAGLGPALALTQEQVFLFQV